MSLKLTHLDHLLAVFGEQRLIEHLEEELRTVAGHHSELAEHLRTQLATGAFDHPHSLITPTGAVQLAAIHDSNAADSNALANTLHDAPVPRP